MSVFRPDTLVFRLRWDFPIEIGLVDAAKAPVSEAAFQRLRARKPELGSITLEAYNEQRRSYWRPSLPPFIGLFGAVASGAQEISCWLVDGYGQSYQVRELPPAAGAWALWNDFLFRLAAACRAPADSPPAIYPEIPSRPLDRWVYPQQMAVLATGEGLAAAVPWKAGVQYLKFNRPERAA
jgi:hypothetical protein